MTKAIRKVVLGLIGIVLLGVSGASFYGSRYLAEAVVAGPGVKAVKKLSDYAPQIEGSPNDCNVYVLEGDEPGGTLVLLGGTHPEEPAGRLAAWLFAETGLMERGKLILILSANRSASTVTRLGGAYPADFAIPTPFGERTFRLGDRWSNPLDQWPDPEVYIHHPSGQHLAYVDVRNLNRCWPGRPDGTMTEKTCYALMELIRQEHADIVIDLHEAELQYPVISTIVAHESGQELAMMVSMLLTDLEGFNMGMEFSPENLHGLSHREIGDHSDAVSLLFEAPEPFLDATRGRTTRQQLLTGQDEFVVRAGKAGLLFESIDENGWPIDVRVGRHTSAVLQTMETWSEMHPDRALACSGVPRYADLIDHGLGSFFKDPARADPTRLWFE